MHIFIYFRSSFPVPFEDLVRWYTFLVQVNTGLHTNRQNSECVIFKLKPRGISWVYLSAVQNLIKKLFNGIGGLERLRFRDVTLIDSYRLLLTKSMLPSKSNSATTK